MKNFLRWLYVKVGRKNFEVIFKGAEIFVCAVCIFLIAVVISGCVRKNVNVYEIHTSGVAYKTSPTNKRIKVPVETEKVFWIVEN